MDERSHHARVEGIAQTDRQENIRVTLRRTAYGLDLFFRSVQHIMVEVLQDQKACDKWVTRALTDDNKAQKKDGFQQLLAILCST
jgi:hypothetical protein